MPDIIGEVGDVILKQNGFQSHFHIFYIQERKRHMHSVESSIQASIYMCTHVVWSGLFELMCRMWGTSYTPQLL